MLQRNAEGVERVVVGGEEYMTVADRHAGQMRIGFDCVSARVQLLAGSGIESVQSGVAGALPPSRANTTPLAIAGGAGLMRSREIQAGVSTVCPSFSSTLKATMLPCGAGPLVAANFTSGSTGPAIDANTQAAPDLSCQVARPSQAPRFAAFAQLVGLRQGRVMIGSS